MEKYIYDPTNGWCYELVGDYYLPCMHSEDPTTNPDCYTPETPSEEQPISTWGNRHLSYLRKHSPAVYREFLRSGTLHSYLAEIGRTAQAMYYRLIKFLWRSFLFLKTDDKGDIL